MNQQEFIDNLKKDFFESQQSSINPEEIKSLCLVVGPYRNLTTLISAIVSLHPNAQVLNHAFDRVVAIDNINIFKQYSNQKFHDFVKYLVHISKAGTRGSYGGSILHSHAYANHPEMKAAYEKRYGSDTLKSEVETLFWKESLSVTRYLRDATTEDVNQLLSSNKKLRLLQPVRNPIDCAISNLNTGTMASQLTNQAEPGFENTLQAIFNEFIWFDKIAENFPDQAMYYTQDDISDIGLSKLANFLDIQDTEEWHTAAKEAVNLKPSYEINQDVTDYYHKQVDTLDVRAETKAFLHKIVN